MNNNNLEYYKLDFYDKRMKLISEVSWEETNFDIGGIVGGAVGIAGSLGSITKDIVKLSAYFAKNFVVALTPKEIEEAFAKKKKEIQDEIALVRSKSDGVIGGWNTFTKGMSKDSREIFKSIDRNIEKLDRRSQRMFREAGLSESQTLALLFSTNPALVLADYLKIKKSRDPKDPNADKKIDNIQKAIANTLINSVKGQKNADDVKKYCKNKIINRENVKPDYLITQNIQDLIETWINKHLGNDASKILFEKITSTSLQKTSKKLMANASNDNAKDSFDLIKNILSKIDKQKKEEDKNKEEDNKKEESISRLQFNNKSLLLVESSNSVGLNKSVLYNTIAWLILETANASLLNENLKKFSESNEIIEAIKQYINRFLDDKDKEAENIDIDIDDDEASNEVQDEESNEVQDEESSSDRNLEIYTPEQIKKISEFANRIQTEFVNNIAREKVKEELTPKALEAQEDLLLLYIILSSFNKDSFDEYNNNIKEKISLLSNSDINKKILEILEMYSTIENQETFLETRKNFSLAININTIKSLIEAARLTLQINIGEVNKVILEEAFIFDYAAALDKIKADRIESESQ